MAALVVTASMKGDMVENFLNLYHRWVETFLMQSFELKPPSGLSSGCRLVPTH